MRTCKKCGVEKEDELFPISRGYRENECRECRKIYLREYYQKNRERLLAIMKDSEHKKRRELARRKKGMCVKFSEEWKRKISEALKKKPNREKHWNWKEKTKSRRHSIYYREKVEEKMGRKLKENEIIHHIDGNKFNDNIDNLMAMDSHEHLSYHARQRMISRDEKTGRIVNLITL